MYLFRRVTCSRAPYTVHLFTTCAVYSLPYTVYRAPCTLFTPFAVYRGRNNTPGEQPCPVPRVLNPVSRVQNNPVSRAQPCSVYEYCAPCMNTVCSVRYTIIKYLLIILIRSTMYRVRCTVHAWVPTTAFLRVFKKFHVKFYVNIWSITLRKISRKIFKLG